MKEKILMILFILILGSVFTVALIAVDSYTFPFIEKNSVLKLKTSVLAALDLPVGEDAETVFAEKVRVSTKGDKTFFATESGSIAFQFTGPGLWGPITGVLALRPDFATIDKITIIDQEETPGLGSRIAESSYLETLENKTFSPDLELVPPGKGTENNQVDAISGATMSSAALVDVLNDQREEHRAALEGD